MNASERYFALLDPTWPMNMLMVADLARSFPAEYVEDRWSRFVEQRVQPRVVVTQRLTLADAGTRVVDFAAAELPEQDWDGAMAELAAGARGTDVPMGCRFYSAPGENRSRLVLVMHHATVDGRLAVVELQQFLRVLADQPVPGTSQFPMMAHEPPAFPWQLDRGVRLDLLRELQRRSRERAATVPSTWPEASTDREIRMASVNLSNDESRDLLETARQARAGALPTMAAAWMASMVTEVAGLGQGVLDLGIPVDLNGGATSQAPHGMNVAVLTNRYAVGETDLLELARTVKALTVASVAQGLGALMLDLTRVAKVTDFEAGVDMVAAGLAVASPFISVTNLGVIDATDDPEWVNWMCGYLAPSPNHSAFISGLGYRGRMINSISTDDLRLSPHQRDLLVAGFRSSLRSMAAQAPAGPHS